MRRVYGHIVCLFSFMCVIATAHGQSPRITSFSLNNNTVRLAWDKPTNAFAVIQTPDIKNWSNAASYSAYSTGVVANAVEFPVGGESIVFYRLIVGLADTNTDINPGIYSHRIHRASSSNGLDFVAEDSPVIEHASVPEILAGPDGNTWIYFVNGRAGEHGIWIAREDSAGAYEITDRVLLDGIFNGDAVDPDVVALTDGRFRLFYYEGFFTTEPPADSDHMHPMFAATSIDGVSFVVDDLSIEVEYATDPSVVQLPDGDWLMALGQEMKTVFAHSADGIHYTLTAAQVEGVVPELVVLGDGRVRVFVSEGDINSFISSDDGETWTREAGARLSPPMGEIWADPSVLKKADGTWEMMFKVNDVGP